MPDMEDYLKIYKWHGLEDGDFLHKPLEEETLRTTLEQLSRLARHHSPFNDNLPMEFIGTLRHLEKGEEGTLHHFEEPINIVLFLSDFLDYLKLISRGEPA